MANWQEKRLAPRVGLNVSFNSDGSNATYVTREESRQSVKSKRSKIAAWILGIIVTHDVINSPVKRSKIAAGLLAIFLGAFGVHKFYLGYIVPGFLHPTFWILGIIATHNAINSPVWFVVSVIISLVEGIIYLTKSDEDFHQIYVANRRALF